jgi:hypothetical protein
MKNTVLLIAVAAVSSICDSAVAQPRCGLPGLSPGCFGPGVAPRSPSSASPTSKASQLQPTTKYIFRTFDAPGAGTGALQGTVPTGISARRRRLSGSKVVVSVPVLLVPQPMGPDVYSATSQPTPKATIHHQREHRHGSWSRSYISDCLSRSHLRTCAAVPWHTQRPVSFSSTSNIPSAAART